jgi:hypothetical protein
MKRAFLFMLVPPLLVALGSAQTPAASSNNGNTNQVNIKGCLGGSDGNYTVAEDATGKIFKITTSSADLKAYVGQDVNLTGSKAAASENSLAITGLTMISEHCAAAAAAPAAAAPAASVSTPSQTVDAPAAAPAAAAPAPTPTDSAPADAATPPATASASEPSIVSSPAAADAAAPAAAAPEAAAPSETVSAPTAAVAAAPADATVRSPMKTADAVHRTRPSARRRRAEETSAETPAATAAPAEPVTSTPVADAAAIAPAGGPPPATASTPAAPATKASAGRSAGMLVGIVVVLLLVGAGVPLYNRWRKRKLLEQTEGQNLSFTKEAKSDPGKSDTTGGRKAA